MFGYLFSSTLGQKTQRLLQAPLILNSIEEIGGKPEGKFGLSSKCLSRNLSSLLILISVYSFFLIKIYLFIFKKYLIYLIYYLKLFF